MESQIEESVEQKEETKESTTTEENLGWPKWYLLYFNIGKVKNFGRLIRSAAAFGVSEIFVVSKTK